MRRSISVKTRLSAVNDYVRYGKSLREVSQKHGVSVDTIRRWLGDSVRKVQKNKGGPREIMSGGIQKMI